MITQANFCGGRSTWVVVLGGINTQYILHNGHRVVTTIVIKNLETSRVPRGTMLRVIEDYDRTGRTRWIFQRWLGRKK
jgi:hypothetical protein